MEKIITIKDNWQDVTIADYIELQGVTNEIDVIFILTNLYSIKGVSENDLIDILNRFIFLQAKPSFEYKNSLLINGYLCNVYTEIENITASQFIDIQHYQSDYVNNLHNILSIICIPNGKKYNENYKIPSIQKYLYENTSICTALGIYNNLQENLSNLIDSFSGLFEEKDEDISDEDEDIYDEDDTKPQSTFNQRWGWVYLAEQVSIVKRCSIDDVFSLNVMEFLNYCSYVKEKNMHESSRIEEYKQS